MKDLNKNSIGYKFIPDRIPVDWNKTYLGKIGRFSKGNGITKVQLSETGSPCIRYGEIYTTHDFVIKKFHSFISDDIAKESKEIAFGDLLFAGSGETLEEIGKCVAYIGNDKAYAGGDIIIFSPTDEIDTAFLSFLLHTDYVCRQKRRIGQGHSVVHIYSSDIANIQVAIPTHLEQVKISKTFSIWDRTIETTENLITAKEQLKKGLMQQLLTGKKRLPGFNGEWKNIKLKEIVSDFIVPMRDKPKDLKGNIPWCRIEDFDGKYLNGSKSNQGVTDDTVYKMNLRIYPIGTLLVSCSANLGVCAITTKPLITNQTFIGLVSNNHVNTEYLYYLMTLNATRLQKLSTGTTITYLSREQFENFKVFITQDIEEQNSISKIISLVDSEIEILKSQLEFYRQQKKGLMQVLLTGAVRVRV